MGDNQIDRARVLEVRNFRISEGGDDSADADLLQRLDLQLRSSVSMLQTFGPLLCRCR
jgi:hypothetical protein